MTGGHVARPGELVTPGRIGLYALMTTIWGSSFFFTALALRAFNPFLLVQLRMVLATVVLGLVVVLTRRRLPQTRRLWGHFVVLGLISIAMPYTLLTWAQVWVNSSTAIVLSSTTPIFVFLFATFVTRAEKFSTLRLVGIVLAFGGVVLLTAGGGGGGGWFWPVVIVVTSAVYAVANIYTRTFVSSVDPIMVAFLQLGFGMLWLAPVTTMTGSWHVEDLGLIPLIAVLELGILGSAFAYVLFFYFIRTWGSTATSMNTYLQPAVGVLLGVVVLHERPSATGWIALAIILAGVIVFGASRMPWGRRMVVPERVGSADLTS
ncbi:DMT family transporter [Microbacterium sp.]|uniref:DMT family transporter n=1 Tax=Microbacterium sp. TaxID=51671 RepID=UPI0028110D4A|nr:DMT family transporter [Microbacterium sp.]